jgi:cell division protein FtsQ
MRFHRPNDGAHAVAAGAGVAPTRLEGHRGRSRTARERSWGRYSHALSILAALLGGVCFLALTDGGRRTRQVKPLIVQVDRLAERLGLGLDQAWVSGHRKTSDRDVLDALDLMHARSLFGFDKAHARRRIEALPWVADVRILTVWPHRVEVRISEREPFAVWRQADHDLLIDRAGRVLARIGIAKRSDLPVVAGAGASTKAAQLSALLAHHADLNARVLVSERVGERRWTLHLVDGSRIDLPEKDAAAALDRLMQGRRGRRLIDVGFQVIDFRDPAHVRIRRAMRTGARRPS